MSLLDRQELAAFVLDLQRGVLDVEPLCEEPLQAAAGAVAVVVATDEQVRGHGGKP